jgi:hypothetical protein
MNDTTPRASAPAPRPGSGAPTQPEYGHRWGHVTIGIRPRLRAARDRRHRRPRRIAAAEDPDGVGVDSNGVGIAKFGNGYLVADAGGNDVVSTRKGGSTVAVLAPVPHRAGDGASVPPFSLPAGFPAQAVPTDVVQGPDGAWYVSQLVGFPFEEGSSTIWRVLPGQQPTAYATGLTNVTSLAFASDGPSTPSSWPRTDC